MTNVLQGATMKEKINVILRKNIEHVNDEDLVLSSSGVVLDVNEAGVGRRIFTKLLEIQWNECIVHSTYNTKINPTIPRTKLCLNYMKYFQSNGQ